MCLQGSGSGWLAHFSLAGCKLQKVPVPCPFPPLGFLPFPEGDALPVRTDWERRLALVEPSYSPSLASSYQEILTSREFTPSQACARHLGFKMTMTAVGM